MGKDSVFLSGKQFEAFLRSPVMFPFEVNGATFPDSGYGFPIMRGGVVTGMKPADQRRSYPSNNANPPEFEQQGSGIIQAHAVICPETELPSFGLEAHSPTACGKMTRNTSVDGVVQGARLMKELDKQWALSYDARGIGWGFDHFTGPEFSPGEKYNPVKCSHFESRGKAKALIEETYQFLLNTDLEYTERIIENGQERVVAEINTRKFREEYDDKAFIEKLVDYLMSDKYEEFYQKCVGVARVAKPTRHMVEMGDLPFALNLATSKEMRKAIKKVSPDTRLELSIIDTPEGPTMEYFYLDGGNGKFSVDDLGMFEDPSPDLHPESRAFAKVAVVYKRFTGADATSSPMGTSHAMGLGTEKRGLDIPRIYWTQKELYEAFKVLTPNALHGGTSWANWVNPELQKARSDAIKRYVDVPAMLNAIRQYDGVIIKNVSNEQVAADVMSVLDGMRAKTADPDVSRGITTQININTRYLAEVAQAAQDRLLSPDAFASCVLMEKKSADLPTHQIKDMRNAVIYSLQLTGSYGRSPFGGGVKDAGVWKDHYMVPKGLIAGGKE